MVDGKERRLTVTEARKMMGIPENFVFPVSETQAMKQLGNGVAVPAVQVIAEQLIRALESKDKR